MPTKNNTIIVMDLEATCLENNSELNVMQEIIQIGLCKIKVDRIRDFLKNSDISKISNHSNLYIIDKFKDFVLENFITEKSSYYVKPKYNPISKFCTNLTGITQKMVDNANPLYEVINTINKKYSFSNSIVATWGQFDLYHLKKESEIIGANFNYNHSIDVKKLYGISNMLKHDIGLSKALEREKIEFIGKHHNAIYDAINTALLLIKILYY